MQVVVVNWHVHRLTLFLSFVLFRLRAGADVGNAFVLHGLKKQSACGVEWTRRSHKPEFSFC